MGGGEERYEASCAISTAVTSSSQLESIVEDSASTCGSPQQPCDAAVAPDTPLSKRSRTLDEEAAEVDVSSHASSTVKQTAEQVPAVSAVRSSLPISHSSESGVSTPNPHHQTPAQYWPSPTSATTPEVSQRSAKSATSGERSFASTSSCTRDNEEGGGEREEQEGEGGQVGEDCMGCLHDDPGGQRGEERECTLTESEEEGEGRTPAEHTPVDDGGEVAVSCEREGKSVNTEGALLQQQISSPDLLKRLLPEVGVSSTTIHGLMRSGHRTVPCSNSSGDSALVADFKRNDDLSLCSENREKEITTGVSSCLDDNGCIGARSSTV
jgi:hypothetical protein